LRRPIESALCTEIQIRVATRLEQIRADDRVDLAVALRAVPAGEIDLGADGGHYGRRTNAIIADAVLELLPRADR